MALTFLSASQPGFYDFSGDHGPAWCCPLKDEPLHLRAPQPSSPPSATFPSPLTSNVQTSNVQRGNDLKVFHVFLQLDSAL